MVFREAFCAKDGSPFTNSDGHCHVPSLNWNGDERNLNANDLDNDWNSDNRFLVLRTSLQGIAPLSMGSYFVWICFNHPPTIFPISFRGVEMAAYFL